MRASMQAEANMLYTVLVLVDETRAASKSNQAASGRPRAGPITRSAAAGTILKEQSVSISSSGISCGAITLQFANDMATEHAVTCWLVCLTCCWPVKPY